MKTLNIDSRKAVCTRQRSAIPPLLSKHITISERKQSNRFSLLHESARSFLGLPQIGCPPIKWIIRIRAGCLPDSNI